MSNAYASPNTAKAPQKVKDLFTACITIIRFFHPLLPNVLNPVNKACIDRDKLFIILT